MKIRILNARDVRALLPMARCIELMRQAMTLVAQGETVQPVRTALQVPSRRGLLSMMPGYTAEPRSLGVKVVTVYPQNFGTELASHQGMVLLFDPEWGYPSGILDGCELTAIRTAAATAVATDVLARPRVSTLGVLGYGDQAHAHLKSLRLVRAFEQILVWGRSFERASEFCSRLQGAGDGKAVAVRSAEDAIEKADVICTVTAAAEPILMGRWLRPGQHLNVVGSSIPTTSEIDVEAVVRSRYFVDFEDSALALAGDFKRAKAAGAVTDEHIIGSIGDVIVGRVAGRTGPSDITLFKSLGMVCEDLVAADFVLREAQRLGVGTLVEW